MSLIFRQKQRSVINQIECQKYDDGITGKAWEPVREGCLES